jgi:taurine transport system ATP-binding protein
MYLRGIQAFLDLTRACGMNQSGEEMLPTGGQILFDGSKMRRPHKDRGVVFQKHALLPWLNELENAELGLRLQGIPRNERRTAARRC